MQSGSCQFQDYITKIENKTTNNITNLVLLGSFSSFTNKIEPFMLYDAKVYGFKIYESDNLIMDFIPCYSLYDRSFGLYDLQNKKYYVSDGMEDFINGSFCGY